MGRIRTLLGDLAYDAYGHRLTSSLPQDQLPAHVGVILDGNRRWAAEMGSSSAHGHRAGGEKITEFLGWCEELGVEVVTLCSGVQRRMVVACVQRQPAAAAAAAAARLKAPAPQHPL